MKKILFLLVAIVTLAFTSCCKQYCYVSNLTGIYTSASTVDSSTVILAPEGQTDLIMIRVLNNGKQDSIYLTPMVMLDDYNNIGNFYDENSGWQGDFSFSNNGETASLTMVNQKTGEQLPIINLVKTQFGNTIAGDWADPNAPQKNNMTIVLCRLGVPDCGTIKINGTDYLVTVYGPDSKYGRGTMFIDGLGWASYYLSAMTTSYNQSIFISLDNSTVTLEMARLIGQ